jgi:Flp pilus assembly protein TadG
MNYPESLRFLRDADHGSALVELALVIPILLLFVTGAIDIGHAGYVGLEVQSAAHAGVQYGSLNPSDTAGVTAAARQSAPNLANLTVSAPTWGCECSDGSSYSASCVTTPVCVASNTRGSNVVHRVQVTTSVVYRTLLPWPGIPSSITMSSKATLRGN